MRELHGWTPKTVTLDTDGNVVSVTATQSRFTPREVALLLASRREENAPRGSHGFKLSEATDPENKDAFTVPLPITDFAEKALIRERKKYSDRWGQDALDATLWRVEKKD